MATMAMAAADGKKKGRRTKIPTEFIIDPKQRCVAFSKRKKGLFSKCAALSSKFSGAVHIAAVVFSQQGKVFSFGHPSPDAVIHRCLSVHGCGDHPVNNKATAAAKVGFWWDNANVGEMNLEELEQFKSSLEELKRRALEKVFDLRVAATSDQGNSIDDSTNEWLGFDLGVGATSYQIISGNSMDDSTNELLGFDLGAGATSDHIISGNSIDDSTNELLGFDLGAGATSDQIISGNSIDDSTNELLGFELGAAATSDQINSGNYIDDSANELLGFDDFYSLDDFDFCTLEDLGILL